jgi:hypothetical protein
MLGGDPSLRQAHWPTGAESRNSQARSLIRCIWILRRRVRLACHARFYTEPRGASTLADPCAPPPHAGRVFSRSSQSDSLFDSL